MKRLLTIGIAVAAFLAAFAVSLQVAPRFTNPGGGESKAAAQGESRPPESEELPQPALSPTAIAPDIPTTVTLSLGLPDPSIRGMRLQFFDATSGKWKTLGNLRDDGRFGDQLAGDDIFTLQVRFLDSGGNTHISVLGRVLKDKGDVSSPALLRLLAKRKGVRARVVSPTFTLAPWQSFTENGGRYSLLTPSYLEAQVIDQALVLTRPGNSDDPEQPALLISHDPNPDGLNLEQYYDGDPGRDLVGQSQGVFTQRLVGGETAFEFIPTITFAGEVVVIVPRGGEFLVITDEGSSFQAGGLFDSIVDTIRF